MICIYPPSETDFSTLGTAVLQPTACTIEEKAGGAFELTLKHPVDDGLRWTTLQSGCILRAPCAAREAPVLAMLDGGSTAQTVTRSIYRVATYTGKRLRLRAKPSTSAKVLGYYNVGTEVVRASVSGDWAQVVVCRNGAAGYMSAERLQFVRDETETVSGGAETVETVVRTEQTRDQLFRIYSVERDVESQTVTAHALHIFYDLSGLIVDGEYAPENVPADTALQQLLSRLSGAHDFTFHCSVTAPVSGDYTGVPLVRALLDPETGIVAQTGARIIRDNFDVYITPDLLSDRGMELRHRKNLLGATMKTDDSRAVTRIKPVGQDKDGNRLTLTENGGWVASESIDLYPVPRDAEVEYDVRVGDGDGQYANDSAARARLKELALQDFANGADLPEVSLDVSFVLLQNTVEYAEYAHLAHVFLYDTVRVIAGFVGINAKIRVNGYAYDCLNQRYDEVRMGEITDVTQTVYGYELAAGSVSGTRIIPASVDGGVFKKATIQYAKIALAAVEQLSANAITAVRADIHELVAGSVTTDQLYVDLAALALAQIDHAEIKSAQIKDLNAAVADVADARIKNARIAAAQIIDLNAAVADIADARIKNAKIDGAQITDATITNAQIANGTIETAKIALGAITTALIAAGAIGTAQIADGSITSAKIVELNADLIKAGTLSVERLLLKGPDGLFRAINATDSGLTSEQLSEEQYQNMISGTVLVARSVTAEKIAARSITANEIAAGTITAGELAAGSVTTDKIEAGAITTSHVAANFGEKLNLSSNAGIKLLVDADEDLDRRMTTAEQQITAEAIVSTVTESAAYQELRSDVESASDASETALGMAEVGIADAGAAQTLAQAAKDAADAAAEATVTLSTQVTQTANGLSVVQTRATELEGRVETIESGVHIEGAQIGIYTSGSPFRNTITHSGWVISENDSPIITCAETKLTAPRVQVTDALLIGGAAWKPSSDKHLRLLKYGR